MAQSLVLLQQTYTWALDCVIDWWVWEHPTRVYTVQWDRSTEHAFEHQRQCFLTMTVCKASSQFLCLHQQRQAGSKSLQQGPQPQGLPQRLRGKELACRKHEFRPWVERSPGERNGNPSQHLWREIPWTEEPCGLQSLGSKRVGHDLAAKQQSNHEPYSEAPCLDWLDHWFGRWVLVQLEAVYLFFWLLRCRPLLFCIL